MNVLFSELDVFVIRCVGFACMLSYITIGSGIVSYFGGSKLVKVGGYFLSHDFDLMKYNLTSFPLAS